AAARDRASGELARTRTELTSAHAEQARAQAELRSVHEDARRLAEEVARLRGGSIEAGTEQTRLAAEVERLRREIGATDAERARLAADGDRLRRDHAAAAAEAARLAAATRELTTAAAAERQARAAAEDRAADLDRRGATTARELEEARATLAAATRAAESAATRLAHEERARREATAAADAAREEAARRRAEHDLALAAAGQTGVVEAEVRDLRVRLQIALTRAAEVDAAREQAARLRDEVAHLEGLRDAAAALEELRAEQRQLRLTNHLLGQRVAELQSYAVEVQELRPAAAELAAATSDLARARDRVRSLEAQLFSAGPAAVVPEPPAPVDGESVSLDDNLRRLVDREHLRVAVVADDRGLLIAAAGDNEHQEGIAAIAGLAEQMALRATEFLPLDGVRHVRLRDRNDMVLSCVLFRLGEEVYSLSTLGRTRPEEATLEAAVSGLSHALGG
ncbi:MAG TPA: hypothetical protein VGQ83_30655, partial [Polyangia bacterium]